MKQENLTHNGKKNRSLETDPEVIKIKELVYKDVKLVIINIIHTSTKPKKRSSIPGLTLIFIIYSVTHVETPHDRFWISSSSFLFTCFSSGLLAKQLEHDSNFIVTFLPLVCLTSKITFPPALENSKANISFPFTSTFKAPWWLVIDNKNPTSLTCQQKEYAYLQSKWKIEW